MNRKLIEDIICPVCGGRLSLCKDKADECGEVAEGLLLCSGCSQSYPIRGYIPRFVPKTNYASNFGFEWNCHAQTQIDKFNGTSISRDRFFRETRWTPESIKGLRVLEACSGAGRFSQVALDAGALLYSFDLSEAVDSNYKTNSPNEHLTLVQASVYQIPFKKGSFDKIYCFGALQHTPDPEKSFQSLVPYLAIGGELIVDVYAKRNLLTFFQARYLLRPITRRIEHSKLYRLVRLTTPGLLGLVSLLERVPVLGRLLMRFIPVSIPGKSVPSSIRLEWAILNTFDALSPKYDRPQSARTLVKWLTQAGLDKIEVFKDDEVGVYVGRGIRSV